MPLPTLPPWTRLLIRLAIWILKKWLDKETHATVEHHIKTKFRV